MAEQTFKSPGFFEREIEVIRRPITKRNDVPVGVIGTSRRGPAFVPTTIYSSDEFSRIFGQPDRRMTSNHAVSEFFRNNGKALTFCRTLGSGYYDEGTGLSVHAGFKFESAPDTTTAGTKKRGAVHFLVANHKLDPVEFLSLGMFNDNDSHTTNMDEGNLPNPGVGGDPNVQLIRAMLFTHKDYVITVGDANTTDDHVTITSDKFTIRFKTDAEIAAGEGEAYEVSLDPTRDDYIAKVLNTDPLSFDDKKHLLYAHFPVDKAVADPNTLSVGVVHGNDTFDPRYNDFSSRFTTPETPSFISQPFGSKEYDLFHIESLDDGAYASAKYKISISSLRASTDPTNDFGTFNLLVRDLRDTDESPVIYESYTNCSLDPNADNFVAKVIGDQKLYYNYEADSEEKRLVREGTFQNASTRIRIVMSDDVMQGEVPQKALPFGFRGVPALLLNANGTDTGASWVVGRNVDTVNPPLDHSVMPPLPYRFKITKGSIQDGGSYNQAFTGDASNSESVDLNLYWGLMTTTVDDINQPNSGTNFNMLIENYTKFLGANSMVVSKSKADSHNNNKFSLAKVSLNKNDLASVTGTLNDIFKDAVYMRNADAGNDTMYSAADHLIKMGAAGIDQFGDDTDRVSLAKLLSEDAVKFNKYNLVAKFTAPFYGGFDGLNILDSDSYYMTDLSASIETNLASSLANGKAHKNGFSSGILKTALTETSASNTTSELVQGFEDRNNIVASFRNAITIMTDEMVINHNVLSLPGIRDPFLTDFAKQRVEAYGRAMYLMDIPQYDKETLRIFVNERGIADARPDVSETAARFELREVNSSYVATYFPDANVLDSSDSDEGAVNVRRSVRVPPSVVALGALAKTDDVAQPWFAPAGFTRGALETITSIDVRLNSEDRDTLYESRINPIANFPNKQFVIFGQKTSQLAKTALDRVNVRRLVLEVKRQIGLIAQRLLFEQNNKATRDAFIASSSQRLAGIQLGQGIEDFRVIMDETNNSSEDVDNNRLNGKIIIVPTRAVEFIAIDFVITNAGVEFP